jgi:hypothetical protein
MPLVTVREPVITVRNECPREGNTIRSLLGPPISIVRGGFCIAGTLGRDLPPGLSFLLLNLIHFLHQNMKVSSI